MITDEQLISRLRSGMAEEVRGHFLDRDAVRVREAGPRKRSPRVYVAAAVCGIAVVAAVALGYTLTRSGSPSTSPPAAATCTIQRGVLPSWARAGFSDPRPVMPYVLGDHGKIIAILFVQPLTAPPRREVNNKILWVSPHFGMPLVIHASLGDTTVTRTVTDGPGPSIIDLPRAGCWTFDLSWGSQHDTLRLPYSSP